MLNNTQELIRKISSNALPDLEIKRGDGSDMFDEKDFVTLDTKKYGAGSATFNSIKGDTQYFDIYLYPNSNYSNVQARLMKKLMPGYQDIFNKSFPLLNSTNYLKVTLLPSEDYVVMGGSEGYVYMINIKTCSIEATQQFCKADITHIKYDPTLNLFVTRSVGNPLSFFRYHETQKVFSPVSEIPQRDLDAVLRALQSNTSIKKFTLKDEKELDEKNIQCLYDLTKIRPGLTCDFAVSTMQQLNILRRLESTSQQLQSSQSQNQVFTNNLRLKSEEIKSLELKHGNELKNQKEAFDKESQKKDEEIKVLKKSERCLQIELKKTTEFADKLLEEKQENTLKIEKLEKTLQEYALEIKQGEEILKTALKKPANPLPQQIAEAECLDQNILQRLMGESIENLNLIKFREDKLLQPFLDKLIAKKAIIDINSLITAINSVNENSSRSKIGQLVLILEELIRDFTVVPLSIKKEMKNLISNRQELLSSAVKEQYDAYIQLWKEKTYEGDDETDLDIVPVSKKVKAEAEKAKSQILYKPLNKKVEIAIENAGKEFLNELANKLKQKLASKPGLFSSSLLQSGTNEETTRQYELL